LLEGLNHWPTRNAVEAERALLKGLGGGCAVPIAAYGQVEGAADNAPLKLEALVCNVAGTKLVRHEVTGTQFKCEELGSLLARHLIAAGAYELLHESEEETTHDEIFATAPSKISDTPTRAALSENKISPPSPSSFEPTAASESPASESSVAVAVMEESLASETFYEPPPVSSPEPIANSFVIEESGEVGGKIEPPPHLMQASAPVVEPSQTAVQAEAEAPAQPLSGKRIIVTRARHQADSLAHALKAQGAEVISCPTIEIRPPESWRPLDEAIGNLRLYQWLVFTSSNGVNFFLRRFDEMGHGRAELAALKICAVGQKTAEKLIEERLQVDLTPEKFTAENLAAAFIRKFGVGQRIRGTRMLLPAAKATRDVIRPSLAKLGVTVEVVEAYQNVLPDVSNEEIVSLLSHAQADYVIFTSPSTVNNLAVLLDSDNLAVHLPKTRVACIGPVTAKAAEQCGLTVHLLPDEHTAPAIVDLLVQDSQA
jgi:uroporphyrinogen-III synthase